MQTIAKSLPDLGGYFKQLQLCDRILNELTGNQNLLALAWKNCLYDKDYPRNKLLKEISQCIQDNRKIVVSMIGEQLVSEIENIYIYNSKKQNEPKHKTGCSSSASKN